MNEKEYIERDAAKKKHCEICMEECICYRNKSTCNDLKAFDLIPAADVRPVRRGKWSRVYDDFMKSNYDTCSCCGKEYFGANGFNFCPNCGADMRDRR